MVGEKSIQPLASSGKKREIGGRLATPESPPGFMTKKLRFSDSEANEAVKDKLCRSTVAVQEHTKGAVKRSARFNEGGSTVMGTQRRKAQGPHRVILQAERNDHRVPNHKKKKITHATQFCRAMHNEQCFAAFYASSLGKYSNRSSALNPTSKRVRIPAKINDHPVNEITIDSASDITCIAANLYNNVPP